MCFVRHCGIKVYLPSDRTIAERVHKGDKGVVTPDPDCIHVVGKGKVVLPLYGTLILLILRGTSALRVCYTSHGMVQ